MDTANHGCGAKKSLTVQLAVRFTAPQARGAVGLDPIVSMFVIFSGGALFGLPGMIIAFPLAGSVKVVLDRLIRVTSGTSEAVRLPSTPLRHRGSQSSG